MPTVTLSNLQSRVYSRIDDNMLLYESAAVTSAINEAIRVTNLFVGYIQTSGSVTSRPNQVWYPMPFGILIPIRLQFENAFIERFSLNNMGQAAPQWLKETTRNTGVPVSHWVAGGLDKFAIHPADSVGGNNITVTGIAEPSLLVNLSDTISFPDEYSEAIEDMAFMALILKEGGKILSDGIVVYQAAISKLKQFSRWQDARQPVKQVQMVQRR